MEIGRPLCLVADSGSTKCDWAVIGPETVERRRTAGINAVLHTPGQIDRALDEAFPADRPLHPRAVWFYGAGCGDSFAESTRVLRGRLVRRFGDCRIEIASDLLGAARALCCAREGIACILGTGSNSGLYDGNRIVDSVPPLGYVLGDEGSGAALGRRFLGDLLKGLLPRRLAEEFYAATGLDYAGVIARVYREPQANRFLASSVPFIRERIDRDDLKELVRGSFRAFVDRNLFRYPRHLEVSFVGGVAAAFENLLREVLAEKGYRAGRIISAPLDELVDYHHGSVSCDGTAV